MSCELIRAELDAYLDGELEAERAAEVAAHLAGCADCAAALAERRLVVSALQSLPRPSAPAGFAEKFVVARQACVPAGLAASAAAAAQPRPLWRRPWLAGSAAAAAAALLLTVTLLGAGRGPGAVDAEAPCRTAPPCAKAEGPGRAPVRDGGGSHAGRHEDRERSEHDALREREQERFHAGVKREADGGHTDYRKSGGTGEVAPGAVAAVVADSAAPAPPPSPPRPAAPLASKPAAPAPGPAPVVLPPASADEDALADLAMGRRDGQKKQTGAPAKLSTSEGLTRSPVAGLEESREAAPERRSLALRADDPEVAVRRLVAIAENLGGRELASSAPAGGAVGVAAGVASEGAVAGAEQPKVAGLAKGLDASREKKLKEVAGKPAERGLGYLEAASRRAVILAVPASRLEAFQRALAIWDASSRKAEEADDKKSADASAAAPGAFAFTVDPLGAAAAGPRAWGGAGAGAGGPKGDSAESKEAERLVLFVVTIAAGPDAEAATRARAAAESETGK
ncbi:MAG TPA: zf-HC2 domain-containing protein [Planctomycetota bacterium]|nr:zf-HC2 domain-containing protein [Planctomycetota bacterium]